jgi:hypothetical protein
VRDQTEIETMRSARHHTQCENRVRGRITK